MNKILIFIKRIILGAFVLYGYNLIATNFNMVIPINIFTIVIIGLLGCPALLALLILKVIAL